MAQILETDLTIGPSAIDAYSRLSYTMWYALAEFIDNSTQSRLNYPKIDKVLEKEGSPLVVSVDYSKINKKKTLTIRDNSIGMSKDDLVEALRIANRTKDSQGRSKYGMGMKTAACWIAKRWKIITTEYDTGEEWTAEVDVDAIVHKSSKIRLTPRKLETKKEHYTTIVLEDLNRTIQTRTEDTIKQYLGSIYRFDLAGGRLKILFNNEPITPPDEQAMDTDPEGKQYRDEFETTINGKKVKGWFGVLRHGAGGRKYAGFSLFQSGRMIQGFPNAYKPRALFGGVDEEGANNLVAQRLTGVIDLDGFHVSHTKDAILFQDDEEDLLEKFLFDKTKVFRQYAGARRGKGGSLSKEKMKDLLHSIKSEFVSGEMKDTVSSSILPPYELIAKNNKSVVNAVKEEDKVEVLHILPELKLTVYVQERSEHEPHLTIDVTAEKELIVVINRLHPYYSSLTGPEAEECLRQYIYDALAESQVVRQHGKLNPDSVRRLKNEYLRARVLRLENQALDAGEREIQLIEGAQKTG